MPCPYPVVDATENCGRPKKFVKPAPTTLKIYDDDVPGHDKLMCLQVA
jgi:hypothetical protein